MRLPTPRQLLVCLDLTGAFGHVGAAELRHLAPESAPAAVETTTPCPTDRLDEADIDGAVAASHAQRTQKPKPQAPAPATTTRTTGGDSRMLPARFHSFLPGMFR
jgi:hypothetical protein